VTPMPASIIDLFPLSDAALTGATHSVDQSRYDGKDVWGRVSMAIAVNRSRTGVPKGIQLMLRTGTCTGPKK